MNLPETRYALSGGQNVAYQVYGDGDVDLIYCAEFWNSIEAQWMEPRFEAFLRRLASFSRLIMFDQRGTGLSDPVSTTELPPLEQWIDDIRAVMDATGSQRTALLGSGAGGAMAMVFAATFPERTTSLILLNAAARLTRSDDYAFGRDPKGERDWRDQARPGWGRGTLAEVLAPTVAHQRDFRDWWARNERLAMRPGMKVAIDRMAEEVDIRHVLPSIQAPTLILVRAGNRFIDPGHSRYLADHIPGARFVALPGDDYLPFVGDSDAVVGEIEEFLTGFREAREPERLLATVVFTDIVASTERVAAVGDRRWRELLDRHREVVRRVLARYRGREVDTTGDGVLATFDGPGRAIRAAEALRESVRDLGFTIRAGVHTGEIEVAGEEIRGIAVHIGARVAALAGPGEVLVSSTVKDLVAGSDIGFEDVGIHSLKGVPGEWRLFRVTSRTIREEGGPSSDR